MGKAHSQMPARAPFLPKRDLQQLFKLLDKDKTGQLQGEEVEDMFTAILGYDTGEFRDAGPFSMNIFAKICEDAHLKHPEWNVAGNLMTYLREHKGDEVDEDDPESDPNPLCDANMKRLFAILDTDGCGEVSTMEVYKLFKASKLPLSLLLEKAPPGDDGDMAPMDVDTLQTVLRSIDEEHPGKGVGDKVVEFLQEAMANGKPEFEDVDPAEPDEPPPEEEPVGNKKALLVGINYLGQDSELGGCINDVRNEMAVLIEQFGFEEDNILLLTEDQDDDSKLPTAENMRAGLKWLVEESQPGDFLFFAYSGHGSQMNDSTGEEPDGKNECLCPLDCMENPWPDYVILDNELKQATYDDLPDGVRLLCIYDCCHSGTMADLQCNRDIVPPGGEEDEEAGQKARWLDPPEDVKAAMAELPTGADAVARAIVDREAEDTTKLLWTISGCQDSQTSADATIGDSRQGALTWGLLSALEDANYSIPYDELLTATRKKLEGRYTQIPAMSTTAAVNFRKFYLAKAPE